MDIFDQTPLALAGAAPLHAGSILPDVVIDHLTGVARLTSTNIIFVRKNDPNPGVYPFLRLREDNADAPGVWYIEDRPTVMEKAILHAKGGRFRKSTLCVEADKDGAARILLAYVGYKRNRLLGLMMPTQIELGVIFKFFRAFLDGGAHNLTMASEKSYRHKLTPLMEFFGHTRLGQLGEELCKQYYDQRLTQADKRQTATALKDRRLVTHGSARSELTTLGRVLTVWMEKAHVNIPIRLWYPPEEQSKIGWLDRNEVARVLWALRGRVWNQEKDRWMVERDRHPTLVGPEDDKRVIDIGSHSYGWREAMKRFILLGAYSGTRHSSMLKTTYREENKAHLGAGLNSIHRRGKGKRNSKKSQTTYLLVPKINSFVLRWARRDAARGISMLIHRSDGGDYRKVTTLTWQKIEKLAGFCRDNQDKNLRQTG